MVLYGYGGIKIILIEPAEGIGVSCCLGKIAYSLPKKIPTHTDGVKETGSSSQNLEVG